MLITDRNTAGQNIYIMQNAQQIFSWTPYKEANSPRSWNLLKKKKAINNLTFLSNNLAQTELAPPGVQISRGMTFGNSVIPAMPVVCFSGHLCQELYGSQFPESLAFPQYNVPVQLLRQSVTPHELVNPFTRVCLLRGHLLNQLSFRCQDKCVYCGLGFLFLPVVLSN